MYTIISEKNQEMMKWELIDNGSMNPVDLIVNKKKGTPVIGTKRQMFDLMENTRKWKNENMITKCRVVKIKPMFDPC